MSLTLAARNLALVAWNQSGRLYRRAHRWALRRSKHARESAKHVKARVRLGGARGRDAAQLAYAGTIRSTRYWERIGRRIWPVIARDVAARRVLRSASRGARPILVGPWLSEVGYEALYWIPFVRWFADHYHVEPERLIAISRGGVASWYGGIAARYVEQLDLFAPGEFAARNERRTAAADQKQLTRSAFDEEILSRASQRLGLTNPAICHPSSMFGLLRQFWLGNESLQYVLEHTRYAPITARTSVVLPPLPPKYVAVKFYTGRAVMDTPRHRDFLRSIVERLSQQHAIVTLSTGLSLDEHEDYVFRDIPNVITLDRWMTPQNNLAVQTEVIRGAQQFVGTCGSLAWLAPMLGTPTIATYADDRFLTSHLYAARHAYQTMGAAPFVAVDLNVFTLDFFDAEQKRVQRPEWARDA